MSLKMKSVWKNRSNVWPTILSDLLSETKSFKFQGNKKDTDRTCKIQSLCKENIRLQYLHNAESDNTSTLKT